MPHLFAWPAEPEDPRKPVKRTAERCRKFEERLARSYAEMRARRREPA